MYHEKILRYLVVVLKFYRENMLHSEQSTTKCYLALWKEYNVEEDSQSSGWTTSLSGLVWV